jgi:hypothetical protein
MAKPLFKIIKESIVKGDSIGHLVCETIPEHPDALNLPDRKKKYVYLHRVIMENHLGKILDMKKYEIHHKDEDPSNNALSNLKLTTHHEHAKTHSKKKKFWKKSPRNKPGRKASLRVSVNFVQLCLHEQQN